MQQHYPGTRPPPAGRHLGHLSPPAASSSPGPGPSLGASAGQPSGAAPSATSTAADASALPNDPDHDGNALVGARNAALFLVGIVVLVMLFRWLA